ncbi:MAG: type II secretion system protein GspD [Spartobacteria bacterium]|nr:type II secretion system protein GspD [Spartobacteria bacterium]
MLKNTQGLDPGPILISILKHLLMAGVSLLIISSPVLAATEAETQLHDQAPRLKSLSVKSLTMRELAELLSRSCHTPVMVSSGAADVVVRAYMENVNALDALKTICRTHGLWYRVQPNGVIEVISLQEFREGATVYQEDHVEVITILYPAAEDIGETLFNLYPDRVVWTKPDGSVGDRYDDIQEALDRMDQLAQRAQFALNSGSGSSKSSDDDDDNDDDDNNDTKGPLSSMRWQQEYKKELLSRMTAKDLIALEKSHEKSLWEVTGEYGYVYVSAFPGPNQLVLRSTDKRALEQIKKVVKKLDTITPQVLLEVKVLEVDLNDQHDTGIDWLFQQESDNPRFQASGGFANGFPSGSGGNQIREPNLLLQPQGTGLDPRAFVFNFISDDIRARLNLLEQQGRLTQLATPSLTVADSEASIVFIGTELTVPISVETTPEYNSDGDYISTTYTLNTEQRNVGDTLLLTPKLHADRTVTLRILEENSQLGSQRQFAYGRKSEYTFDTQDIDKRTVASTVVAGDGTLVALGGLIREKAYSNVEGIPFLMNLPFVGSLFKRETEQRERSELLVIIRPYILVAPGETEQVSSDFLERISQHPSAQGDIPALDVSIPEDIAKPKVIKPGGSFYDKIKRSVRIWSIEP